MMLRPLSLETVVCLAAVEENLKVKKHLSRYLFRDRSVRLYINGGDLKTMGIKEGKRMGEVLNKILCLKVEGKVKTRNEELRAARNFV